MWYILSTYYEKLNFAGNGYNRFKTYQVTKPWKRFYQAIRKIESIDCSNVKSTLVRYSNQSDYVEMLPAMFNKKWSGQIRTPNKTWISNGYSTIKWAGREGKREREREREKKRKKANRKMSLTSITTTIHIGFPGNYIDTVCTVTQRFPTTHSWQNQPKMIEKFANGIKLNHRITLM